MRLRPLVLSMLVLLALIPLAALMAHSGEPSPTEGRAIAAALQDHTTYALPAASLQKARALYHFRVANFVLSTVWGVVSIWLLLQIRMVAGMSNLALRASRLRWIQGLVFLLLFLSVTTVLTLPLDLYAQHVRLQYGLSVQGWGSWFGDQGKGLALTLFFGWFGVMILFWLMRKAPRTWWLWLSFVAMAFTVLAVFATPVLIDPLFNQFEPLSKSNPQLVKQLEKVVARGEGINIPPERMFLMKASDKVTTLNAYVTGFGASKRVVVWDTSIAKGTPDEILFIFGHEMGHYVLGHIVSGILFAFLLILFSFGLGFYLFEALLQRYGAAWGIHSENDWGALPILVLVLSVVSFFSEPLENAFSRRHEHAADVYGEEVVHGIVANPQATGRAAFQLLGENSFDYPFPSKFYDFWTGSHPPTWFRAAFAKDYDPWAAGEAPKYFKK